MPHELRSKQLEVSSITAENFETILKQHPEVLCNRKTLQAIINDCYPTNQLENFIILAAFDCGIVEEIQNGNLDIATEHRVIKRMQGKFGIEQQKAIDGIHLWFFAYGHNILGKPVMIQYANMKAAPKASEPQANKGLQEVQNLIYLEEYEKAERLLTSRQNQLKEIRLLTDCQNHIYASSISKLRAEQSAMEKQIADFESSITRKNAERERVKGFFQQRKRNDLQKEIDGLLSRKNEAESKLKNVVEQIASFEQKISANAVLAYVKAKCSNISMKSTAYFIYPVPDGWIHVNGNNDWQYYYGKVAQSMQDGYIGVSTIQQGNGQISDPYPMYIAIAKSMTQTSLEDSLKTERMIISGLPALCYSFYLSRSTYIVGVLLYFNSKILSYSFTDSNVSQNYITATAKQLFSNIRVATVSTNAHEPQTFSAQRCATANFIGTPQLNAKGNVVKYGRYVFGDKVGPIEWLVLRQDASEVMLLCSKVIDAQQFNSSASDVTWETSFLRKYLNSKFFNTAFTQTERALIVPHVCHNTTEVNPEYQTYAGVDTIDKVFLLSYQEIMTLLHDPKDRICMPTQFVLRNTPSLAQCWWWLRSPGKFQNGPCLVLWDGTIDFDIYDGCKGGVRPVICVKKSALNHPSNIEQGVNPGAKYDMYHIADYQKYNCPASVNGLRGDLIRIHGKIDAFQDGRYGQYFIFQQQDGKKWLVICGKKDVADSRIFSDYVNQPCTLFAEYMGYSEVYRLPTATIINMGGLLIGINMIRTDLAKISDK